MAMPVMNINYVNDKFKCYPVYLFIWFTYYLCINIDFVPAPWRVRDGRASINNCSRMRWHGTINRIEALFRWFSNKSGTKRPSNIRQHVAACPAIQRDGIFSRGATEARYQISTNDASKRLSLSWPELRYYEEMHDDKIVMGHSHASHRCHMLSARNDAVIHFWMEFKWKLIASFRIEVNKVRAPISVCRISLWTDKNLISVVCGSMLFSIFITGCPYQFQFSVFSCRQTVSPTIKSNNKRPEQNTTKWIALTDSRLSPISLFEHLLTVQTGCRDSVDSIDPVMHAVLGLLLKALTKLGETELTQILGSLLFSDSLAINQIQATLSRWRFLLSNYWDIYTRRIPKKGYSLVSTETQLTCVPNGVCSEMRVFNWFSLKIEFQF